MPPRRPVVLLPATASVHHQPDKGYATPLDHLQDYARWVKARAGALEASWRSRSDVAPFGVDRPLNPAHLKRLAETQRQQAAQLEKTIATRLAANRRAGRPLPVDVLCDRLDLQPFDRHVLLLTTLAALDLSMEAEFERCAESCRSQLTVFTAFTLLDYDLTEQLAQRERLRMDAPLRQLDLVTLGMPGRYSAPADLLRADLEITEQGLTGVLGHAALSDDLLELSSLEEPLATFEEVVLPQADEKRILSLVDTHARWPGIRKEWGLDRTVRYGRGSFMLFSGPPGTGKTLSAHAIAHRLGKRVLTVDIPTLAQHVDNRRLLPGLFREARLRDALLFFDECESLFRSRRLGNQLMTMLLTELERFDGVAVLATNLPEELDDALFRRILLHVRFAPPDREARRAMWSRHLPPEAPVAPDVDLDLLARRYPLTGGEMKNVVLTACARAFGDHGEQGPITLAHLEQAAQEQLGTESAHPAWNGITLEDVHLTRDVQQQVREFVASAGELDRIRDGWGIGARDRAAHCALFHGSPGTGKTLCARAVAGELGRPLVHEPIGSLRSRWVGESEQNLARLFERARREGAVLLLDEVDAIAAPRGTGQIHDDALTSSLLTLLDQHDGVVILTTNRADALEPALARRILWRMHFPRPDLHARLAIWQASMPSTAPLHGDVDLHRLAARPALSGAEIRVVALRAAARASATGAPIDQRMLDDLATAIAPAPRRAVGFSPAEA